MSDINSHTDFHNFVPCSVDENFNKCFCLIEEIRKQNPHIVIFAVDFIFTEYVTLAEINHFIARFLTGQGKLPWIAGYAAKLQSDAYNYRNVSGLFFIDHSMWPGSNYAFDEMNEYLIRLTNDRTRIISCNTQTLFKLNKDGSFDTDPNKAQNRLRQILNWFTAPIEQSKNDFSDFTERYFYVGDKATSPALYRQPYFRQDEADNAAKLLANRSFTTSI